MNDIIKSHDFYTEFGNALSVIMLFTVVIYIASSKCLLKL